MKKISLKNVKETLTRKQMKAILGGYDGYEEPKDSGYCAYTCRSGGGSGSSSNTTMEGAVSIAISNCGDGNYSVVCVGF